ncbi:hypothetical protein ACIBF8_30840, partial [Micromonospora sp. NPDC050276]
MTGRRERLHPVPTPTPDQRVAGQNPRELSPHRHAPPTVPGGLSPDAEEHAIMRTDLIRKTALTAAGLAFTGGAI